VGRQASWFDRSNEERAWWSSICPEGQYRIVPPNCLPPIVPSGLLAKADSVCMVSSGSTQGQCVFMANINRVEQGKLVIDQEPFGIAFIGNQPIGSGILLHHGGWAGRTTPPPQEFWWTLANSGIGQCWPIPEIPTSHSGAITDLRVPSQHEAFKAVVSKFQDWLQA
jgi:hypothetical protein